MLSTREVCSECDRQFETTIDQDFTRFWHSLGAANILESVQPAASFPATISMGVGIGSPVGGTCQLLSGGTTTAPAGASPQLSGTIPSGTYCLMVYDVGNQAAPITYTAVVSHY